MPLQKQTININFQRGLDTKTDPFQIDHGKFLQLNNSVFTKGGRLTKRNGFGEISSLPAGVNASYTTTYKNALTVIGNSVQTFSENQSFSSTDAPYNNQWIDHSIYFPCNIAALPLVRSNTNQSQVDSAIAPNGLICVVYTDQDQASLSTNQFTFAVLDSTNGQTILPADVISFADPTYGFPRVFVLGNYFVILFQGTSAELRYLALSTANPSLTVSGVISTSLTPTTSLNFDAAILINPTTKVPNLFIAWCGASTTGINMAYMTPQLVVSSSVVLDGSRTSTEISVSTDYTQQIIYTTYYNTSTKVLYTAACNPNLIIQAGFPVEISSGFSPPATIANITSVVSTPGLLTIYAEVENSYFWDSTIPSNYIHAFNVNSSGAADDIGVSVRSVGLASKAFVSEGNVYYLASYQSDFQSSYFLICCILGDTIGFPVARLAYQNGGGYVNNGLPSVSIDGNQVSMAYLFKDQIQSVNKGTNLPSGTQVDGIYSQLGINLATFTLNESAAISSLEIGNTLNINGGFLWTFDGVKPVENDFLVYPDLDLNADGTYHGISTTHAGTADLSAQEYFYQFTYEWTDNQGNAYRSAPSVPINITTTGSSSTNTIYVPTLRLTYKTANPVKIVGYRWSTAQQNYYQFTSISMPTLNPNIQQYDFVEIVDALPDSAILGNNLIYTTGGVVEDVGPPAFNSVFSFDDRLWGITGEDENLLWYSKQVIEATPVEMSDLFTEFVAPALSAIGPSGPLLCGAPMDDKLVLFKQNSLYYINGSGPDNTGANSQYSQPIFITSMVGCSNQQSIVFQPQGLMFEYKTDAGNQIWILGRDLSTQYIGAPVEQFTANANITSAVAIPGTNQVRFSLDSGVMLMYDYYYGQWGTFQGISAIASTVYQNLHTAITLYGQILQETEGLYLDGSNPVVMSFTTGWFNLAGLQGYERFYFFYLLGTYYSPHKLTIQIAYDYNSAPSQQSIITPNNYNPFYGGSTPYGNETPYGGNPVLEQWRVFTQRQTCQAFQIIMQEIYDSTLEQPAGAGLTISGLDLVVGLKRGYRPLPIGNSVG